MTVNSSWMALLSSVAAASPAAFPDSERRSGVAQSRPSGLDVARPSRQGCPMQCCPT